jgi:hypothetical protein
VGLTVPGPSDSLEAMSKDQLPPEARAFFAKHGSVGGKAKGKRKARTKAQASRAAKARWAKVKGKK